MAVKRLSCPVSDDLHTLVEEWCIAEGTTPAKFLLSLVCTTLDWTEPAPSPKVKKLAVNKRATTIQAAIDAARSRLNSE